MAKAKKGVRLERTREVSELCSKLGLEAQEHSVNFWFVYGSDGFRGGLVFNQRSKVWRAFGGSLSKTHYGVLGGLLNLLACTRALPSAEPHSAPAV